MSGIAHEEKMVMEPKHKQIGTLPLDSFKDTGYFIPAQHCGICEQVGLLDSFEVRSLELRCSWRP